MKSFLYGVVFAVSTLPVIAAPPIGDTQGTVASVKVRSASGTVNAFEVWFSQVQNDRWGCTGQGFIVVYDNGYGVTPNIFKQMFALAMLAQASGKPLALDSAATNPCSNVNSVGVVN